MFLYSSREDKRFWIAWEEVLLEFNLLLISSWMQYWFVMDVPKYFNCATFSKDVFMYVYTTFSGWDAKAQE